MRRRLDIDGLLRTSVTYKRTGQPFRSGAFALLTVSRYITLWRKRLYYATSHRRGKYRKCDFVGSIRSTYCGVALPPDFCKMSLNTLIEGLMPFYQR